MSGNKKQRSQTNQWKQKATKPDELDFWSKVGRKARQETVKIASKTIPVASKPHQTCSGGVPGEAQRTKPTKRRSSAGKGTANGDPF